MGGGREVLGTEMSIVSTSFLFLFMPVTIGIYFLIPFKNGLKWRNVFMLLVSLFFYAWGEPIFIILLLFLSLLVWLLGKMAEGQRNTAIGKWAVALTVFINVSVLLSFKYLSQILDVLGALWTKDLSSFSTTLPIGLSFFSFHAISYVVDIYRGQCHSPKSILNTTLYLSVFFKMLQGPIITYREFEPQIDQRSSSWNNVCDGVWRLAIGFGKKMVIAANLAPMVKYIFMSDLSILSMADAWIGCVSFMVFMYFDFSGYSDMAIGLGRVFGFKVPENFNYPYISTSVSEYWRRWHITLIDWFRDYLYYPILLGPSVRLRKYLLRHNISSQVAKSIQNIFVPACVWLVTALWHGTNWNYTLWGVLNCIAIEIEFYFLAPNSKRATVPVRWMGVMMFLLLTVPLINTISFENAGLYIRAMFAGTGQYGISLLTGSLLDHAIIFLTFGIVGCFPVISSLKRRWYPTGKRTMSVIWNTAEVVLMMAVVIVALAYLFNNGKVWFLYQQ